MIFANEVNWVTNDLGFMVFCERRNFGYIWYNKNGWCDFDHCDDFDFEKGVGFGRYAEVIGYFCSQVATSSSETMFYDDIWSNPCYKG